MEGLYKSLSRIDDKNKLKDILWLLFYEHNVKYPQGKESELSILILNTPCNGFGDLVFAYKLANYLREWYKAKVSIATTLSKELITLGEKQENILKLVPKKNQNAQCRRFANLKIDVQKIYDLIFIAPLMADYNPSFKDISSLIPYANKYNTFFFSEYNDSTSKSIDFQTGIGGDRIGMLFTDMPQIPQSKIKGAYALFYIAEPFKMIPQVKSCFFNFLEMLTYKYKYKKFQIICPAWVETHIDHYKKELVRKIDPYYDSVIFQGKTKVEKLRIGKGNTLVLRGDIFPVSMVEMGALIRHSVKDVLLTGDQSITDALSCCPKKNIFYQIAPWKESLGYYMYKLLPHKYLKGKRTSCGTKDAITYTGNYTKFVKQWDFRKLARPKMDSIILSRVALRADVPFQRFYELVLQSKTIKGLKKRVEKSLK